MDYGELRTLLINERKSNSLQKVNNDFYEELGSFVQMEEDLYKMRSKKICSKEIIDIRFQKIIKSAMNNVQKNEDTTPFNYSHMTSDEKKLYNDCIKLFKEWKP